MAQRDRHWRRWQTERVVCHRLFRERRDFGPDTELRVLHERQPHRLAKTWRTCQRNCGFCSSERAGRASHQVEHQLVLDQDDLLTVSAHETQRARTIRQKQRLTRI